MSLKSKFKAFASAYKSALKNGNNDEWSNSNKKYTARDIFHTLQDGAEAIVKLSATTSVEVLKGTARLFESAEAYQTRKLREEVSELRRELRERNQ